MTCIVMTPLNIASANTLDGARGEEVYSREEGVNDNLRKHATQGELLRGHQYATRRLSEADSPPCLQRPLRSRLQLWG